MVRREWQVFFSAPESHNRGAPTGHGISWAGKPWRARLCLLPPWKCHQERKFLVGNEWCRNIPLGAKHSFWDLIEVSGTVDMPCLSSLELNGYRCTLLLAVQSELAKQGSSAQWDLEKHGLLDVHQPAAASHSMCLINAHAPEQTLTPGSAQDAQSWWWPVWSYGGAEERRRLRRTSCRRHRGDCLGGQAGCPQAQTGGMLAAAAKSLLRAILGKVVTVTEKVWELNSYSPLFSVLSPNFVSVCIRQTFSGLLILVKLLLWRLPSHKSPGLDVNSIVTPVMEGFLSGGDSGRSWWLD